MPLKITTPKIALRLRRNVILVVVLFIASIWLLAAYELSTFKSRLVEEAETYTQVEARVFAEYSISTIRRLNETLLDLRPKWGGDPDKFSNFIQEKSKNVQDLTFQIAVIDERGMLAFTSIKGAKLKIDLSDREHFKVHADNLGNDDLFISKPLIGKVSGKKTIQFTRPIFKDEKFIGVIVASVDPQIFSVFSKTLDFKRGSVAKIIRSTGEVVSVSPESTPVHSESISDGPYLSENSPQAGYFRGHNKTGSWITGFQKNSDYGLNFTFSQSDEDVLAPYVKHRRNVFMLATVITALTLFLFLQFMRALRASEILRRDIEAQKHAAEDANLAKSQFLANMSHEIRTPMNAILGMHKLLESTSMTASQLDYASKARVAAESLLGILNDILDFSKIDAGKMEIDIHPFRIDKFMSDLAVVLSASVQSKNVEVIYDLDLDLPASLVGDSMRLRQVLINLAGNAIKFTESGQIVIGARVVDSKGSDPQVLKVEFLVKDSGIGIAQENQAKIFNGFSQAESSTSRRFGGTGLGLAISQKLVKLMGGQIHLVSELGVGSEFSFCLDLPVNNSDIEGESRSASLRSNAKPEFKNTVLVVDDNPIARELIGRMMRSFGWEVDVVESGYSALETIIQKTVNGVFPYRSIYLDWQMPDLDGWQTLARIKELATLTNGPEPKFTIVTANGRDDLSQRTQDEQNSIHAFLTKPLTASEVMDASQVIAEDKNKQLSAMKNSKRQLAGLRILVAEDNAINQQVAEELLTMEGATVSIVGNGRLAVNAVAAAKVQFDAVLMDVQMPVMDGFSATRTIRTKLGIEGLPIIGLTANAMASDKEDCIQAGMDAHIGKPFDMDHLVHVLLTLTAGKVSGAKACEVPVATTKPQDIDLPDATDDMDLRSALKRLGGMRKVYVRAAIDLRGALKHLDSEIEANITLRNWEGLKASLHTMKGNSGTLGLTKLASLLYTLEDCAKNSRSETDFAQKAIPLRETIDRADICLSRAISLLEEKTPEVNTLSEGAEIQTAKKIIADHLVPYLKCGDLEALEVFAEFRSDLAHLPEGLYARLEAALQDLDLEGALRICEECIGSADMLP